jgi:glycosyltransferase involved in cell wall biosynthesis
MRLAGITIVRNECDIVEAFVRHNEAVLDQLYILDNDSSDGTLEILQRLAANRLSIKVGRDNNLPYYQATKTTKLIKAALEDEAWDCVFPLDCDEFLLVDDRRALEAEIASLGVEEAGLLVSDHYAPTELDDTAEPDPVGRIIHRIVAEPALPLFHGKAIAPYALGNSRAVEMGEGNHHILVANRRVPERWLTSTRIAHFPVRSIEQFLSKVVTTRLAWLSRGDYRPSLGHHIAIFYAQLRDHPEIIPRHLLDAAFTYLDTYLGPHHCNYVRKLVRDPVHRRGGPLCHLDLAKISALPRILEFAEQIARQLGQANSKLPLRKPEP